MRVCVWAEPVVHGRQPAYFPSFALENEPERGMHAWVGSLRISPPFALENELERGMHGSAICSFTLERAMPGVA